MKVWIWGPKTIWYNMTSVQFISSRNTPPYYSFDKENNLQDLSIFVYSTVSTTEKDPPP